MANVAKFSIVLDGKEQVFSSIKELTTAVNQAKKAFAETGETGGRSLKEVQRELAAADAKAKDLQKSVSAKGLNENFNNLAKTLTAVSSAFAVAQSAAALFTSDAEQNSKAAAQAQQLLSFALGVSTFAQVKFGEATVAATITLRAETAAANTTNAALKRLYAVIAANPVGALVVALTAAAGALYLLSEEITATEKAMKEVDNVLNDVNKTTFKQTNEVKRLSSIVKDETASEEERLYAYEQLQKSIPSLNNLTYEQAKATGKLDEAITKHITYLNAKALAEAASTKIAEAQARQIQIQTMSVEELNTWYSKTFAFLQETFIPVVGKMNSDMIKVNVAAKERNKLNEENNAILKAFQQIADQNYAIVDTYESELAEIARKEKERAESAKLTEEQRKKRLERLNALLEKQIALQKELGEEIEKRAKKEFEVSEDIVKRSEEVLEKQREVIIDRTEQLKTPIEKLAESLKSTFLSIYPEVTEQSTETLDVFFQFWNGLQKGVSDGSIIIEGNLDDVIDGFTKMSESVLGLPAGVLENFNKELFKSKVPKELQEQTIEYFRNIQQLILAIEKLQVADSKGDILASIPKSVDFSKELVELTQYYSNLLESQKELGLDDIQIQKQLAELVLEKFGLQEQILPLYDKAGNLIKDETGFRQKNNDAVLQLAANIATAIINQGTFNFELQTTADRLSEIRKEIVAGNEEQQRLITEKGFVLFLQEFEKALKGGSESLREFFTVFQQYYPEFEKVFSDEQLVKIFDTLNESLKDTSKFTKKELQDLLAVLTEFSTKFGEDIDGSSDKIEDATDKINKAIKKIEIKEFLDAVQTGITELLKALNQIDNYFTEKAAFEIEKATTRYERERDKITKTDEASNQKRLELEREYQAQKAAIEKKERIRSLRFSQIQTIANGAQAVIKSFAELGPIAGGIAALVQAGIIVAQTTLIQRQINEAQSLRRGGLIRFAGGGYVDGLAHEYGGVRYANGGVELEGKESVINRQSTLQYAPLLSQINQSGGGKPIVVETAMDSRLIEVLAKQKTQPIRAYVVEQDITRAQAINKRLEELSTL